MRTIIAPTNFSDSSVNAVNYAADIALNTGSSLVLLHIIQMPESFDAPITQLEYETMLKDAKEQLDFIKKRLEIRTQGEIDITTKAVVNSIAQELAEINRHHHPFVIVIGPERQNSAERFLFSSHTFDNVVNLPCPVIVVPQNAAFRHIKRIGLATDLQDVENLPVEAIGAMIELFDASLDIIHVGSKPDQKNKRAKGITDVARRLQQFDPVFHFEVSDSLQNGINAYAKRNKEDLIIVLPKRHSFFHSLFRKSKAKQIVLNNNTPVAAIAQ